MFISLAGRKSAALATSRDDGATWERSTLMPDSQLRALSYPCVGGERVHVAALVP